MLPSVGASCHTMHPAAWSPIVTSDEVLTIREAAGLLKLAEKTVYSMTQQGELPEFKIRGQ